MVLLAAIAKCKGKFTSRFIPFALDMLITAYVVYFSSVFGLF